MLEPVEVECQERDRCRVPAAPVQHTLCLIQEGAAVLEPGERIDQRSQLV
jgi:hypothetical protein